MSVAGISIRTIVEEILDENEEALPEADNDLPQVFATFAGEAAESEIVYDDGFDPRQLRSGQEILDGPPAQMPVLLQTCLRLRRRLQEPDLQRSGHDVRLYRLRLALDGLLKHGIAGKPKMRGRQIVDLLTQTAGITDRGMWTALSEALDLVDIHLTKDGMSNELERALRSLRAEMSGARSPRERYLRLRVRNMLNAEWRPTEVKTLRIVSPPLATEIEPPEAPSSRRVRQAGELLETLGPEQARKFVRNAFNSASRAPSSLASTKQSELLMDYVVLCSLPDAPDMLDWVADLAAAICGGVPSPGTRRVIEACLWVLTQPIDHADRALERLAVSSRDTGLGRRARALLPTS